jgi:DNA-binding transcriptional LysR family regulator
MISSPTSKSEACCVQPAQLDLNQLTDFEAIYELGIVSAVADRLALGQSATDHAPSRLREACRDVLFVPARLGLLPTPVFQAMCPVANQALDMRDVVAEVGRLARQT